MRSAGPSTFCQPTSTELAIVSRLIELQTGAAASLDASVSALYGWGGARWMTRVGRIARFAEGGLGFARLTLNTDALADGTDISDELRRDLADENIDSTRLVGLGGVGINVPLGTAWSADFGYGYNRIFTENSGIDLSTLYTAVIYKF